MKRFICILVICLLLVGCAQPSDGGGSDIANESSLENVAESEQGTVVSSDSENEEVKTNETGKIAETESESVYLGNIAFEDRIRVALIDTGVSPHAIPAGNVYSGKNYYDPDQNTSDTYGHGTAVASVILAHAPEALIVPLISNVYIKGRIYQVDNEVFAQMIRDAVDIYDCDIINVSAGLVLDKAPIREAIEYAESQGVLVVSSAGNDYIENPGQVYYPAAYDSVLSVGSLTYDGSAVSEYSQRDEWVDVFAPGENATISTLSGNKRIDSGTSYAVARVTAAAVLILQNAPDTTVEQLRNQLITDAKQLFDGKTLK